MKNASFDYIRSHFIWPMKSQNISKLVRIFLFFLADTLEKLCLAMENIDYVPWDCLQRLKTIRIHFRYIKKDYNTGTKTPKKWLR